MGKEKEIVEEEVVEQPNSNWKKQEGPAMWLPETEGEELIGIVIDIVEGLYGSQYLIKPIGKDEIIRTPSHKVLVNRMVEVKKDDMVKLVYLGQEPPTVKGQNPTKMYEVFIKGE